MSDQGKLKALQLEQATADVLIIDRIKLMTLDIPKELIERIDSTFTGFKIMIGCLWSRPGIIDWGVMLTSLEKYNQYALLAI